MTYYFVEVTYYLSKKSPKVTMCGFIKSESNDGEKVEKELIRVLSIDFINPKATVFSKLSTFPRISLIDPIRTINP